MNDLQLCTVHAFRGPNWIGFSKRRCFRCDLSTTWVSSENITDFHFRRAYQESCFTVGFTLQMVNLCSCHCLSYFPFTVTKSTQITANCSQWDCYRLVTVNSICQFSRWLSSVHFTGYKICCSACDDVSNCCSLRQVSTISQVHCHWDRHSTNTYIVSDISTSKVFINQF